MLSMEAIADPPAYHRARAAVRYDEISSKLVHALKYGDRLDLAPTMGRWMANAGRELLADADAIVPVPLHWRRQWMRRFNQSALLAEIIAKASGRTVAHGALKRIKATPHQVGLGKAERAENVQGAFRVPADGKAEVTGRKLVLVDDVLTSGATVDGCARTCCGAVPPLSMCWYSPGLWRGAALPYKTVGKVLRFTWPESKFTPPAIAPIATPPSGCCRAKGSSSPRSTSAAIRKGEVRWWYARMDA
jgi:ComF family protein